MNKKDCRTLEEVFKDPPPDVLWDDLSSLLQAVCNDYGGIFSNAPGGRIRATLWAAQGDPNSPAQQDTLTIPYAAVVHQAEAEAVADFLIWAGVTPCTT